MNTMTKIAAYTLAAGLALGGMRSCNKITANDLERELTSTEYSLQDVRETKSTLEERPYQIHLPAEDRAVLLEEMTAKEGELQAKVDSLSALSEYAEKQEQDSEHFKTGALLFWGGIFFGMGASVYFDHKKYESW